MLQLKGKNGRVILIHKKYVNGKKQFSVTHKTNKYDLQRER